MRYRVDLLPEGGGAIRRARTVLSRIGLVGLDDEVVDFLSPGFDSARPSRSLLSIFVQKNRAQLLSSFMILSFGD